MVSRRTAALLAIAALVVTVIAAPAVIDRNPTLTVENEDDATYRLTAYVVEDRQRAMLTNFEVTTRDGERRLATVSQLYWPEGYANLTLADDGVASERVVVPPGENRTASVDGWDRGDATVYFAERQNGTDWVHEWTDVSACGKRGQEISVTLEDGSASWSSTCRTVLL